MHRDAPVGHGGRADRPWRRVRVAGPDGGRWWRCPGCTGCPTAGRTWTPCSARGADHRGGAAAPAAGPFGVPQGARARLVRVRAGVAVPRCDIGRTGECGAAGWPLAGWRTPWRAHAAERGAEPCPPRREFARAADEELRYARPLPGTEYKVTLARNLIVACSRSCPVTRVEAPEKVTGTAKYAFEYPVARRCTATRCWRRSPAADCRVRRHRRARHARGARGAVRGEPPELGRDAESRAGPVPDPRRHLPRSARRRGRRGHAGERAGGRGRRARRLPAGAARRGAARGPPGAVPAGEGQPALPTDTGYGDVAAGLAAAAVAVDVTYTTPAMHNNPMEPHAAIAAWDPAGVLTIYDSTQGPSADRDTIAAALGLPPEQVRVISPHVGGGFGSKGTTRPHAILAALAAREVGRPVKVALTRQQMFDLTGYRTPTIQRLRSAPTRGPADRDRARGGRADLDPQRVRRADRGALPGHVRGARPAHHAPAGPAGRAGAVVDARAWGVPRDVRARVGHGRARGRGRARPGRAADPERAGRRAGQRPAVQLPEPGRVPARGRPPVRLGAA